MKRIALTVLTVAAHLLPLHVAQADELRATDFAWRAAVQAPGGGALARLVLPADALARVQTPALSDIRLYGAQGQPVPFAVAGPPPSAAAEPSQSAPIAGLALHDARVAPPPRGATQVRVQDASGSTTLWIASAGKATPAPTSARRLPAALFDTRAQKVQWKGIVVSGEWPANVPVLVSASTSQDLASWTPLSLRGRVYRFDGANAPANDTLEFGAPLALEGRYLRLDWTGQAGVTIASVRGVIAGPGAVVQRPSVDLGAARAAGNALEWPVPFAAPIAQVGVAAAAPGVLLPVRILGRNQPSEPWRLLAQTVVYRLPGPEGEATNPPVALPRTSVRWLRVEATHGQSLERQPLSARALFDPLELVFVASSGAPFELAVGRAGTPAAALPVGMLTAAASVQLDKLPLATVGATTSVPAGPAAPAWLPAGVDARSAALWAVLLAGVAALGATAWTLLRQVKSVAPGPGAEAAKGDAA